MKPSSYCLASFWLGIGLQKLGEYTHANGWSDGTAALCVSGIAAYVLIIYSADRAK